MAMDEEEHSKLLEACVYAHCLGILPFTLTYPQIMNSLVYFISFTYSACVLRSLRKLSALRRSINQSHLFD